MPDDRLAGQVGLVTTFSPCRSLVPAPAYDQGRFLVGLAGAPPKLPAAVAVSRNPSASVSFVPIAEPTETPAIASRDLLKPSL
jgi:hypothetical protein